MTAPSIDRSTDLLVSLGTGSHAMDNIFCELVGDNFLQQFVTGPTHISRRKLDLLLCNCPEIITDVSLQHGAVWAPNGSSQFRIYCPFKI